MTPDKQMTAMEVMEEKSTIEYLNGRPLSSVPTASSLPPLVSTSSPSSKMPSALQPIAHIPDEQVTKPTFAQRFSTLPSFPGSNSILNRVAPPNRRYFGFSRVICIAAIIIIVAILALVLGLAIGLTRAAPTSAGAASRGDMTYYNPSVGLGACGIQYSDSDFVVAVNGAQWDLGVRGTNPNANANCARQIRITKADGRPTNVIVTVADKCPPCARGAIDVSPAAFDATGANRGRGRVPVQWEWI